MEMGGDPVKQLEDIAKTNRRSNPTPARNSGALACTRHPTARPVTISPSIMLSTAPMIDAIEKLFIIFSIYP